MKKFLPLFLGLVTVVFMAMTLSCESGIPIDFGQRVEDSITRNDEYTSWNDGSFYKRYEIKLQAGATYLVSFWTEDWCVLTAGRKSDLPGDGDISIGPADVQGDRYEEYYTFDRSGTWYFFVYVREGLIEPGEEQDFWFEIAPY